MQIQTFFVFCGLTTHYLFSYYHQAKLQSMCVIIIPLVFPLLCLLALSAWFSLPGTSYLPSTRIFCVVYWFFLALYNKIWVFLTKLFIFLTLYAAHCITTYALFSGCELIIFLLFWHCSMGRGPLWFFLFWATCKLFLDFFTVVMDS